MDTVAGAAAFDRSCCHLERRENGGSPSSWITWRRNARGAGSVKTVIRGRATRTPISFGFRDRGSSSTAPNLRRCQFDLLACSIDRLDLKGPQFAFLIGFGAGASSSGFHAALPGG